MTARSSRISWGLRHYSRFYSWRCTSSFSQIAGNTGGFTAVPGPSGHRNGLFPTPKPIRFPGFRADVAVHRQEKLGGRFWPGRTDMGMSGIISAQAACLHSNIRSCGRRPVRRAQPGRHGLTRDRGGPVHGLRVAGSRTEHRERGTTFIAGNLIRCQDICNGSLKN